ncbi:MAG: sugar ABC transporter substrate-binding protein [Candidatus Promineifilaceae bacterium]|nr:sugar ABC transporter substrate-binding protein [Candidatus Promineifilaceae bacterium]
MSTKRIAKFVVMFIIISLLTAACGASEPAVVEVTRVVTETEQVEVTRVVTETIEVEGETVEVTRVVEVQVEVPVEEEAAAEAGEEDVVTISWWGTERGRDTAETRELHFTLARAFEESHPNTSIAVSLFPSRGFANRVLTAIAAGEGPDIWYHYFATDIATQGFLEDLTPFIEASDFDPAERWFPIGNQRAVYDGKFYGVPRDATAGFIAYNMDMFDAAGLPYPEAGWTIEDYRQAAIALTDIDNDQYGIGAIVGSPGCFQWSSFSYNMGAEFVSPDGSEVAGYMDTPEAENALKFCLDLTATDQVAAPPGLQEQFGELVFLSGNVGMQHISTWELPAINEGAEFNWGVVAPPRFDENSDGIAWTDSYIYYMSSDTVQKQRAWEFMEWLSGPEAGMIMAEAGIWTPALPEVWEEMGWTEDPVLSVAWEELQKEARVANYERSQFYWDCVGSIFDDVWTNYVELGETDIAGILETAVPQAQACLDDNYASLE